MDPKQGAGQDQFSQLKKLLKNLMMPDTPAHFQSMGATQEDFKGQIRPKNSPKNAEKWGFMAKMCPYMIIL